LLVSRAMANALLVENRLRRLRDLSRRLELEELAARGVNVEKANHLADAIADLGIMIARLEAEPAEQPPAIAVEPTAR
jgi:hypothetical protein